MTSQNIVLNIVPVSFSSDKFTIGRMARMDKEEYHQLRETHWRTHAFLYDSRFEEVLNIALAQGEGPMGREDVVPVDQHLLLAARAIQQSILVWLARELTILRAPKRLVFWGQADNARLLSRALEKTGLEPISGLEVVLRYEIDCRIFQHPDGQLYLGLVIDLSTSNVIDIPVSQLCEQGFQVNGRYVCRREEAASDYLFPKLEILGRVAGISGERLVLTDTDGVDEIQTEHALLEPRSENLKDVVELYCGANSTQVLSKLDGLRRAIGTASGKLEHVGKTLRGLKKHPVVVSEGVTVQLGDLLTTKDERFPDRILTQRPNLLVGPQGRHSESYPDAGLTAHGPYMYMRHERNSPLLAVICESRYRGRVEQFMNMLRDGFPGEMWRDRDKKNPFAGGLIGKYRLSNVRIEYEEIPNPTPTEYNAAVNRLLERVSETPDLAIVQIREEFSQFYGNDNPYLVSKAAFMMANVPTQSIQAEKIESIGPGTAYLLNTISLATYAKLDGIPWVICTARPTSHELVFGLRWVEVGHMRLGTRTRYVGITSVFQGDGRYLVWGVTREVEYEHYTQALLESVRACVSRVRQDNAWQRGDKVRIICHASKRLRDCEVEAIKGLVHELIDEEFEVEFAFLDISWEHPYQVFDRAQPGVNYWGLGQSRQRKKGEGVPPRGFCVQLDRSRALIQLTGPNEVKTGDQGLPKPLLVELHRDSDFEDMTYLLRQLYDFSYMSWRSYMPGTEPVTTAYSRLIARLLGNLRTVRNWDSRVLIGNLRDRRWFL